MSSSEQLSPKHVRVSGILSIFGLLLIALSLVWNHPISTYVIVYVGLGFVLAGAGFFIYSLLMNFRSRRRV